MRTIVFAMTLLGLSACGSRTTERDFLCDAQTPGRPCATISEVDIGSGNLVRPVAERAGDTLNREISQAPLRATDKPNTTIAAMRDGGQPYGAMQYRVPEQVGTLWIAPHQDAGGLLHEAAFVHFVVRPAHWAGARP